MRATSRGRHLARAVVFLCLVAALVAPVAQPAPAAPLAACAPRPTVGVAVAPGGGGLQVTISATTNGNTPTNQLSTLSFGAATGALIDVPGQPAGQSGNFTVTLAAGTQQTGFTVRQATAGQAGTVPLTVTDTCGTWQTFVGGGPSVFPAAGAGPSPTPTSLTAPSPTRTPTAVKVTSLARGLSSLGVGTPQPATWADIPSPTTQDWIGLFAPGTSNNDYLGSPRFTGSTTPSGSTSLLIPLEATDGNYELRLFSNKTTTQLASSQNFTVSRPVSTPTPVATPGIPPAVVNAPATVVSTGGQHSSIQLDRNREADPDLTPIDLPVVSYFDPSTASSLKVLRCGNKACSSGNSIVPIGTGGQYTSLQLDQRPDPASFLNPKDVLNYPVVSYYDQTAGRLKIVRCSTLTCSPGSFTIAIPDTTTANNGQFTSLALDSSSGNAVVSYYDVSTKRLKVLRCGNLACTAGNSIVTPDNTSADNGQFTSLQLDASGRPVVSYYDAANQSLKLLHCGDVTCTSANTIANVDTIGNVGQFTSLQIGPLGYPVIAYYDVANQRLRVAHCSDQNCANPVNPAALVTVDALGSVGQFASLRLDRFGRAVVGYYDATNQRLKVAYCSRTLCTTPNTLNIPDVGNVGQFTSLVLDTLDSPAMSYLDQAANGGSGGLKILRCSSPTCIATPDEDGDVGQFTSLRLDGSGRPVVSYYKATDGQPLCTPGVDCTAVGRLKVLHCGDQSCSAGNTISTPDATGDNGRGSSLALDPNGLPVVAYLAASTFGAATGQLKVLHCGDASCTAPAGCGASQNCIAAPDSSTTVGPHISLLLGTSGNPAIAYYDNGRLKILRCANVNCTGSTNVHPSCVAGANCIVIVDQAANVGQYPSLGINLTNDVLVASYYDVTNGDLKVARCGGGSTLGCTSGNTVATVDSAGNVGQFSSLLVDVNGLPAVSYYDVTNGDLKVMRCASPGCTATGASCTGGQNCSVAVDTAGDVGQFTSLRIDASNVPVVSYYDVTNRDLKVLRCGNPNCNALGLNCAAGQNCVVSADTVANEPCGQGVCLAIPGDDVGRYTSLAVDGSGIPFVSYYNATNGDLKVLRCRTLTCN
jgi:hypothetical protein